MIIWYVHTFLPLWAVAGGALEWADAPMRRMKREWKRLEPIVAGYERDQAAMRAQGVEWTWSWRPTWGEADSWLASHPEIR